MTRNLVVAGNFNLTNVDELFDILVNIGQHPKEVSDTVTIIEKIGHFLDQENTRIFKNYIEKDVAEYMKQTNLEITIEINNGNKSFSCYTMDFTQKYISINSDYRS